MELGHLDESLEAFAESRVLFEALNRAQGAALSLRQMGDAAHQQGDLRSAAEHLEQASQLADVLSDNEVAGIHISRGSVLLSLQHTEEAESGVAGAFV